MNGTPCPLPSVSVWSLVSLKLCSSCALCHSLGEFMGASVLDGRSCFQRVIHHLCHLHSFYLLFLIDSVPNPWEEEFNKKPHLGLSVPKSATSCTFSSYSSQCKFSSSIMMMWNKDVIYGHINMSLGVISLLCFFNRLIENFPCVHSLFCIRFLATIAVSGMGSILRRGLF